MTSRASPKWICQFSSRTTLLTLLYFGLRLHPNGPHRFLVGPFVVLRPNKGKPSKSVSQALLHSGLGINPYVYIRQQEHRGHTVCLGFMIVD